MDRVLKRSFRKEIVPLLLLMAAYSFIAFFNLGNTRSPLTTWSGSEAAIIDLGQMQYISRFQFMMGARHNIPFTLFASADGTEWDFSMRIDGGSVFAWDERPVNTYARFVQVLPSSPGLRLQEVALRDRYDQLILPYNLFTPETETLFDEQDLIPNSSSFMNSTYFDEIYHARTGYEFLHGLTVLETTHPPMGKNFIALSIQAFGMTPFGWRLPGTLAGIIMIPLMYIFGRMMFRSPSWGMFTAFIFAFDFMPFVQTRIATIDSYVTLFVIASYLCMYGFVRESLPLKKALLWLAGSGLFMGFAIASKWQGVYAAIGLAVLFFIAWFKILKRDKKEAWTIFGCCFAFFVAVPVVVYLLSYIPFVRAMDDGSGFLATVIANQQHMFSYHSELTEEHPFSSRWWEWPLIIRPIFYYSNRLAEPMRQGISSFGNPAVWWVGIFATVYAFAVLRDKEQKEHHPTVIFLLIAYAAQFVPWMFVFRATFIYHYFPSVPFVVLLIAFMFKNKFPRLAWAYGGVVLALFALFYPVLSGAPVSIDFVSRFLRWFPAWILV